MNKVLFDPGYASCLYGVSDSVEFMYSAFQTAAISPKQRKFQFSLLYPKLKSMIQKNAAFYLGCLLWAVYIKNFKNAEIENNPCLNEEYVEEEAVAEPLYLLHFIDEQLKKDVKYYLNKTYVQNAEYEHILANYIEFIKLNKGFVNTKNTDEIILPPAIKTQKPEDFEKIKHTIDNALNKKDLTLLFDIYDLVL